MRARSISRVIILVSAAFTSAAHAQQAVQPPRVAVGAPSESGGAGPSTDLRAHFGVDIADRLMKSGDDGDRLRGLQRAAAVRSPESIALLERSVEQNGVARTDSRGAIEVARALAGSASDAKARAALQTLVTMQWPLGSMHAPTTAPGAALDLATTEAEHVARLALARQIAALALASAADAKTTEQLLSSVKSNGVAHGAAAAALVAYPPSAAGVFTNANVASVNVVRLVSQLGDLRALDAVRASARSTDPLLRAASILALGEMGDMRALDLARPALKERDARVRAAATETLVLLGVPDALKAVELLIGDDATALAGMRLAERVSSDGIVNALAARGAVSADIVIRSEAAFALGRSSSGLAVRALVALLKDPTLHADIANAIARSPSADAIAALEAMAATPIYVRLASRAYVTRALLREERSSRLEAVLAQLAASKDGRDRAVGVFGQVALGERDVGVAITDPDPRVRRAGAMASLALGPDAATRATLLARLSVEADAPTRSVLAIGLIDGDPDARVPTLALIDLAESPAPEGALATLALARRGDEAEDSKVDALLSSRDPILRAHAARGLGMSSSKDAVGRLASAYAYEGEAYVRRAIILAMTRRTGDDASALQRTATLDLAARLDPDRVVRMTATRALARLPPVPLPGIHEVAWLHLTTPDGQLPPDGIAGSVMRADGLAAPCAFDDEGYALVPGVPAGDAQLVLAPRLPAYDGGKR